MAHRNPQADKIGKGKKTPPSGEGGPKCFSRRRPVQPTSPAISNSGVDAELVQQPNQADANGSAAWRRPKAFPAAKSNSPAPDRKTTGRRSLDEKGDPNRPKPKRRRLPDLQTVLDAFDPMDESLEPEPEPGDFWIEPDDWTP